MYNVILPPLTKPLSCPIEGIGRKTMKAAIAAIFMTDKIKGQDSIAPSCPGYYLKDNYLSEDKVAPILNFQEVDSGRNIICIDSKFVA